MKLGKYSPKNDDCLTRFGRSCFKKKNQKFLMIFLGTVAKKLNPKKISKKTSTKKDIETFIYSQKKIHNQ